MNRYLKGLLIVGVPTTVLGLLIGGLFAHRGGPMLYVAVALVPAFAFGAAFTHDVLLLFAAHVIYWLLVLRLFFLWRDYRASRGA